jgi:hypothetical protein
MLATMQSMVVRQVLNERYGPDRRTTKALTKEPPSRWFGVKDDFANNLGTVFQHGHTPIG